MNSENHDRDRKERFVITAVLGVLFVGLIPFFLTRIAPRLDRRWGVPALAGGRWRQLFGALLAAPGLAFAYWTVTHQFTQGKGTPAPPRGPRRLLVDGPYCYCRNPMALGTFLFYLGLALLAGTSVGTIIVAALTALLLIYIKRVEEPGLVSRFGADYEAYRDRTPFLWPRLG